MSLIFDECVLCDLNRSVQDPNAFKCHAYQPILTITKASGTKIPDFSGNLHKIDHRESFRKFLQSDKMKYKKALALQKLNRDPDGVLMELKYHFAWNVIHSYIDAYIEPYVPDEFDPSDYRETREEHIERLRNIPTHLCRLRYFGDEDRWTMAFYTYSKDKYEPCVSLITALSMGHLKRRLRPHLFI